MKQYSALSSHEGVLVKMCNLLHVPSWAGFYSLDLQKKIFNHLCWLLKSLFYPACILYFFFIYIFLFSPFRVLPPMPERYTNAFIRKSPNWLLPFHWFVCLWMCVSNKKKREKKKLSKGFSSPSPPPGLHSPFWALLIQSTGISALDQL